MKRKFVLSGLMGLLFMFTVGASVASAQASFNGTWVLDKSKSTDVPPNVDISMNIAQSGQKINVETKFGAQSFKDAFILNGSAQEVMLDGPNGSKAKGKRSSKKIGDGFESLDEGTFSPEGLGGSITVKTVRKWHLSSDGKTLTLEIARISDMGNRESRRVFRKK